MADFDINFQQHFHNTSYVNHARFYTKKADGKIHLQVKNNIDASSVVDRVATEDDKIEYHKEWTAFKEYGESGVEGNSDLLTRCDWIEEKPLKILINHGIHTLCLLYTSPSPRDS